MQSKVLEADGAEWLIRRQETEARRMEEKGGKEREPCGWDTVAVKVG